MPVHIEKSRDLVGCHHSGTDNEQKRKDRATQPMDHGRLRWAISYSAHSLIFDLAKVICFFTWHNICYYLTQNSLLFYLMPHTMFFLLPGTETMASMTWMSDACTATCAWKTFCWFADGPEEKVSNIQISFCFRCTLPDSEAQNIKFLLC